ncbi:MAG TPA: FtsX-like permease family protein [Ktedonobacterales bacterium]
MKWRLYWSYATRSLIRGGQRSLLAIFCVAVGVMAIVGLQLVSNAAAVAYTANVRQLNGGDLSVAADEAPLTADQLRFLDQLEARGEVTRYTAVDRVNTQVSTSTAVLRFKLRAVDSAQFPLHGGIIFTTPSEGNLASLLQGDSVLVTTKLAQVFHLKVGSRFHFSSEDGRATTVTVAGIIESAGFFQGSSMLMALDAYAALPSATHQPITYDDIFLDVPGHTDANALRVERLVRDQFPLARPTTAKQLAAGYQNQVQDIRYFLQIVGLLALLIGGVGILNTMQVALRRRRNEIAMLKTAGYRSGDLVGLFGFEAGLIGLVGGLVGAAAGAGVSFLVTGLMEQALQTQMSDTIDASTLTWGVAVGFGTALIFGLLPIVQASQVRPQAVLRELPARAGTASRILTVLLALLLVLLFFALAASILQNTTVTLAAIGGTGLALLLLSLVFAAVVVVISRLPVPERITWWYALLVGAALAAALGLTRILPGFGVLLLAAAVLGIFVVLLPRAWKANIKLALRNIGRQRGRTVLTLIALSIGVFAIGLVFVLGQDIQTYFTQRFTSSTFDIGVLTGPADRAAAERQLAQTPGLTHVVMTNFNPDSPVAVNGQTIAAIIHAATANGQYSTSDVTRTIDGVQAYDLAGGHLPDPKAFPLVKGAHDAQVGRNLMPSDAGTTNVLLPVSASQGPLNLKLGDTVTVAGTVTKKQVTVTVVGFYNSALYFAPIQADSSVVTTLTNGYPTYVYLAYVDPSRADAVLARIQAALPSVQAYSLADTLAQATDIINKATLLLVAIASLAMLASVIIIANAVGLALLERRREIGILKAVGYTSRSVLGEVMVEQGAIGFTGGLLAMALVAVVIPVLGKTIFDISFTVSAPTILGLVAGTVLACMAVAASVAWRATRVRPLEVLRYE